MAHSNSTDDSMMNAALSDQPVKAGAFFEWVKSGSPWVWFNAGAVAISSLAVIGLLAMIGYQAMAHFWPGEIYEYQVFEEEGKLSTIAGEKWENETITREYLQEAGVQVPPGIEVAERILIKSGNRELTGVDFVWQFDFNIASVSKPLGIARLERREWGDFYGYPVAIHEAGEAIVGGTEIQQLLEERLSRANELHRQARKIEKGEIGRLNYKLEKLRLLERKLALEGIQFGPELDRIASERRAIQEAYDVLQVDLLSLREKIERDSVVMATANGQEVTIALSALIDVTYPNQLSFVQKVASYFQAMFKFIVAEPREANTEGGVAPAIFGTVLMVLIMSVLVTPFGVIAAIYLREYAHQGWLTRTIRIGVNNLAGVPSIVYGVFGLGFFVYFIGNGVDEIFYPEAAPAPMFGTPGLLWASVTLALLTVPVVIVATEEGLARIPKSVKEGSLALGATQFETLWKVIIPMASPAMMTGLILAVARAAGEVAPLMLVGVVKLAPSLPLDLNMPFLHLERKFMHLGFHIYDVGFQSPNVEAARPLVYATAFLLVLVIAVLNLSAVRIRNRLREKFKGLES